MSFELPPVVKQAERVTTDIENAVSLFPRRHRYQIGSRLRTHAEEVNLTARLIFTDKQHRGTHIDDLVFYVDALKASLQIAKQVQAFRSFAQFEAIARQVSDLGRQCGGLRKHHQGQGQNGPGRNSPAQRPQRLSARGASGEATP